LLIKLCHKYKAKVILHCHYGCISTDLNGTGFWGRLLRKTLHSTDSIWVLDSRSFITLNTDSSFKGRVFITPNPIDVKKPVDDKPKSYISMAFVGNLIPTKGLYELVEAAVITNTHLDIIGPGKGDVIKRVKQIAGSNLNNTVFLHGRLPNDEAINLMQSVDMVALPTYYKSEAFPISILEAMALTKMVISTNRAAIPDILTAIDGSNCGIIVQEKSVEAIVNAIRWCQSRTKEADEMRYKAYEKVKTKYSTTVVYELYRSLYRDLLWNV
jgi:glycosyltransferase involved in cell wall biosynthesis